MDYREERESSMDPVPQGLGITAKTRVCVCVCACERASECVRVSFSTFIVHSISFYFYLNPLILFFLSPCLSISTTSLHLSLHLSPSRFHLHLCLYLPPSLFPPLSLNLPLSLPQSLPPSLPLYLNLYLYLSLFSTSISTSIHLLSHRCPTSTSQFSVFFQQSSIIITIQNG